MKRVNIPKWMISAYPAKSSEKYFQSIAVAKTTEKVSMIVYFSLIFRKDRSTQTRAKKSAMMRSDTPVVVG